jgi:hypothetical protein
VPLAGCNGVLGGVNEIDTLWNDVLHVAAHAQPIVVLVAITDRLCVLRYLLPANPAVLVVPAAWDHFVASNRVSWVKLRSTPRPTIIEDKLRTFSPIAVQVRIGTTGLNLRRVIHFTYEHAGASSLIHL